MSRNHQRRAIATPASAIRREHVEWLLPGRVPRGSVTVLCGVGGLGKSTWTCLLAAQHAGVTLIATAEDTPATTVVPRLQAVGADLDRVRFLTIRTHDDLEDGIEIPGDMAEVEQSVADTGADAVVIDPLGAHLSDHIDSHKDHSVRRALAPLFRLARSQGCAVVVIVHLNKSAGGSPLSRIGGSGAFGNAARSVLLLDRDPDDPEGEEGSRRVLAHVKCNVGPEAPSLLYEIRPILLPATAAQPAVETSRLELLGESAHNGRALLNSDEEGRSAMEEACEFLLGELADRQDHQAGEIFKAARQVGISDQTLKKARRKIGAETQKEPSFRGGWIWRLPQGARPKGPGLGISDGPLAESLYPSGNAKAAVTQGAVPRGRPLGDEKPVGLGNEMYPVLIAKALARGHLTQDEHDERLTWHQFVVRHSGNGDRPDLFEIEDAVEEATTEAGAISLGIPPEDELDEQLERWRAELRAAEGDGT